MKYPDISQEGVTHINMSIFSTTSVGRFLAHKSPNTFVHDQYGWFGNLECFWGWLRSADRDDDMRGMRIKTLKKKLKTLDTRPVANFKHIILDANLQRIKQHPSDMCDFISSTLPLDCYYISKSGDAMRPVYHRWLISGLEEIRMALQHGRAVDLTPYTDPVITI